MLGNVSLVNVSLTEERWMDAKCLLAKVPWEMFNGIFYTKSSLESVPSMQRDKREAFFTL